MQGRRGGLLRISDVPGATPLWCKLHISQGCGGVWPCIFPKVVGGGGGLAFFQRLWGVGLALHYSQACGGRCALALSQGLWDGLLRIRDLSGEVVGTKLPGRGGLLRILDVSGAPPPSGVWGGGGDQGLRTQGLLRIWDVSGEVVACKVGGVVYLGFWMCLGRPPIWCLGRWWGPRSADPGFT